MKKWSEVSANTKLWGGIILAAIVLVMLFALQRDQEPLSLNNLLGGRLINPPAAGGGAQPQQQAQEAGGGAQTPPSPTQASPAAPSQVVTETDRGCEITTTVRANVGQSVHIGAVTCGPQQRQASAQSRASARPATGVQQNPNAGADAVAAARARSQAGIVSPGGEVCRLRSDGTLRLKSDPATAIARGAVIAYSAKTSDTGETLVVPRLSDEDCAAWTSRVVRLVTWQG